MPEPKSTDDKISRPVLRYHGGKWLLAPWIVGHFPAHDIYVELFGGAASVLLRKPRVHYEVYNEVDPDVVNLFRVLRDRDQNAALCRALELTPFSRDEFIAAYVREEVAPVESARRLIVRSFMGFGSSGNRSYITGFRAASKQSGRPHSMDWANVPESLHAVATRLQGVVIENREAMEVIKQQDTPGTLFYADPPYLLPTRNTHCDTYRFNLTDFEHTCLAKALRGIKGMAIISGYPSPLYDDLFAGWKRVERRHKKSTQVGSKESTEVLWMNF